MNTIHVKLEYRLLHPIIFLIFVLMKMQHFNISQFLLLLLPLKLRKAGRAWCCVARKTHSARCHNEVTSWKSKEYLKILHLPEVALHPTYFKARQIN